MNFKEMVLLYEELVRKETLAHMKAEPNNVSGWGVFEKVYGIPAAFYTIEIIYGEEEAEKFKNKYYEKRRSLQNNRQ